MSSLFVFKKKKEKKITVLFVLNFFLTNATLLFRFCSYYNSAVTFLFVSEFCCIVSVRIQFFFCLTNDSVLLGIAKEKKKIVSYNFPFLFGIGLQTKLFQFYFCFVFVSIFLFGIATEKKKIKQLLQWFLYCMKKPETNLKQYHRFVNEPIPIRFMFFGFSTA